MSTNPTELTYCTHCAHPLRTPEPHELQAIRRKARRQQFKRERFLARVALLSEREHAVMLGIAKGHAPAKIGKRLGIDVKTVATYRSRLFVKIEMCRNNAEIAVAAADAGLLE